MAIANPTQLGKDTDETAGLSVTSPSVSPSANALLVVHVTCNMSVAGESALPFTISDTLSDTIAWEKVEIDHGASAARVAEAVFVGKVGASPGSGTVTTNIANNATQRTIAVYQIASGYDTSDWIVQSITAGLTGGTSPFIATYGSALASTSLSMAFAAARGGSPSLTADSDYTELDEIFVSTNHSAHTQYKNGSADTTVQVSGTLGSNRNVLLAIEIRAAATAHDLTATTLSTGAPSLGTPALVQVHGLTGSALATGSPALGTPVITLIHNLTPVALDTAAPDLDTPALAQAHVIAAVALGTGSPTLAAVALVQIHALAAATLSAGNPDLGAPSLVLSYGLTAATLDTGAPVFEEPELSEGIVVRGLITLDPVLGTPLLGQIHVLATGNFVTAAPLLGTPAFGQIHVLATSNLATASPALESPVLGQSLHVLTAIDLVTGAPVLEGSALSEPGHFSAESLLTDYPLLGTPALTQEQVLIAIAILTGNPVLGAPVLTYVEPPTPHERTVAVESEIRIYIADYEQRTVAVWP